MTRVQPAISYSEINKYKTTLHKSSSAQMDLLYRTEEYNFMFDLQNSELAEQFHVPNSYKTRK
jgi:hypothetical protein